MMILAATQYLSFKFKTYGLAAYNPKKQEYMIQIFRAYIYNIRYLDQFVNLRFANQNYLYIYILQYN